MICHAFVDALGSLTLSEQKQKEWIWGIETEERQRQKGREWEERREEKLWPGCEINE